MTISKRFGILVLGWRHRPIAFELGGGLSIPWCPAASSRPPRPSSGVRSRRSAWPGSRGERRRCAAGVYNC